MDPTEEIAKIVDHFSKEDNQRIQEFERSLEQYNKLVEDGVTANRGYRIMSSDKLYNCPESQQIKY